MRGERLRVGCELRGIFYKSALDVDFTHHFNDNCN